MKRALLALYLLTVTPSFATNEWTMVRSQNFLLVGEASESQIRSVAHDLELFRLALSGLLPLGESPVRTTVVVFRNSSSFEPYKLLYNNAPANISGYFA